MSWQVTPLEIPDLLWLQGRIWTDDRGTFRETFKESALRELGLTGPWVQDNTSMSARGVVRGLHFQAPPAAQGKLVTCLQGAVYDVVVDLRRHSPTYGRWLGVTLEGERGQYLWVPPGFAHGFQALSNQTILQYKVTAEWSPQTEGGLAFDDPQLAIPWPIANPVVSARDRQFPRLAELETPFL